MRQLHPDLKSYIQTSPSFQDPTNMTPTETMLMAARCLIGITEDEHLILTDLIRETIAKPWNEPWCADFAQSCIAYAETVKGVKSPIAASEGVLDMYDRSKLYSAIQPARVGSIIIWRLGATQEGHCGFITAIDSLLYETIEGNTSNSSEIDRTGRGVWAKKRAKGGTKTFTEVGFLEVFPHGF